jgi:hypothetical protein
MPVITAMVVTAMTSFDHDRLVDVGNGREGIDRLGSLSTSSAETNHPDGGTSQGKEFTHRISRLANFSIVDATVNNHASAVAIIYPAHPPEAAVTTVDNNHRVHVGDGRQSLGRSADRLGSFRPLRGQPGQAGGGHAEDHEFLHGFDEGSVLRHGRTQALW